MDLLIDDQRTFNVDITARTFAAGIIVLNTGCIDHLYLDFDLGEALDGLQLLRSALYLPPVVTLVTQNPVGLKQMANWLKDSGYTAISNIEFRKNG